jgi:uncharacterized membrane protein
MSDTSIDTDTNTNEKIKISPQTTHIEMKSLSKLKYQNDEYSRRQICMLMIACVLGVCIVGAIICLIVFDILALGNHSFQNTCMDSGLWYFVLVSVCWYVLSFARGLLGDMITIKSLMMDIGLMVWGSIEILGAKDAAIQQTAIYRMALIHVLLNYAIYAGVACLFCIGLYVA